MDPCIFPMKIKEKAKAKSQRAHGLRKTRLQAEKRGGEIFCC